jgi:hypothetical protein
MSGAFVCTHLIMRAKLIKIAEDFIKINCILIKDKLFHHKIGYPQIKIFIICVGDLKNSTKGHTIFS